MPYTFSLFRGSGPSPILFHQTTPFNNNTTSTTSVEKNPAMLLGKTDRIRSLKDRSQNKNKLSYKMSNIINKSLYSNTNVNAYDAMRAHTRIAHHGAAVTGSAAKWF
jgi:hypothetical protein